MMLLLQFNIRIAQMLPLLLTVCNKKPTKYKCSKDVPMADLAGM